MPDINRLVINFPGFEKTTAVHQIERLTAGGKKTAGLWGFGLKGDKPRSTGNKTVASFRTTGPGWNANTRFVQLSWGDIIAAYEDAPFPASLLTAFPKYLSFFLDGSVRKYASASRRYWGFTIYPLLLILLFAAISFGLSFWAFSSTGLHWMFPALFGLAGTVAMIKWPGDMMYVNLSINDWAFARDMCNGANPDISKRYVDFADHLVKEISGSKADEVLIVGHSFGSVWAVASLAIALEKKPNLLKNKRVTFLALGSSLLKIGLVRRAKFFASALHTVLGQKGMMWHEIQTKTDFISFYKSDPFKPMKIIETACEVIVHRVNFKKALSRERHRKMLKSMYLAHRQYILYCDARTHFDFQLRVFGPLMADDLARNPELVETSPLLNTQS